MAENFDWHKLQRIYTTKLSQIQQGRNLDNNLMDVDEAIATLTDIIKAEQEKGLNTKPMEEIKNDFFFLKYLILEQL